jgi:hypothetical protein
VPPARVHIFWQKRIREGDTTTPWWFPCKTDAGAIREDRLVFPMPPGTHWSDAKPIILPVHTQPKQLDDAGAKAARKIKPDPPARRTREPLCGGMKLRKPDPPKTAVEAPKPRKKKLKMDPKFIAAPRELRDRWLEHVGLHPQALLSNGKYDVSRAVADQQPRTMPMLEAA